MLFLSLRDNYALPNLGRLSPGGFVRHGRIDREIQGLIENNPDERPSKSYSQDRTMAISGVLRKPKKKK